MAGYKTKLKRKKSVTEWDGLSGYWQRIIDMTKSSACAKGEGL